MKTIKDVIKNIADLADEERRKDPEYKNLWEKDGIEGLLRDAEFQMMEISLNVSQILEDKYGIKITNDKWDIITSLPMIASKIEKDIKQKEGIICCVDKTFHLLSKIIQQDKEV